jgi:predicted transport protein
VLRNRPDAIVRAYEALERFARSLGPIEIVARERYVLFRSNRIFADAVIMSNAVRIAIHLGRKVEDPRFFKVVSDRKKVTHVSKLLDEKEVEGIHAYLKEAYDFSIQ